MKKLIICAAAAIVALASCSKTQVINTEDPKEINFKAVTGVMTKAELNSSNLSSVHMGAFAYINGNTATNETEINADYFINKPFAKEEEQTTWAGSDVPLYWPVSHNLNFVVYAPWQAGDSFNKSTKTLTITASDEGTDYLYGEKYYDNDNGSEGVGYDKETTSVPVLLCHAKAKVTVNFNYNNVTISNLQLDNQVMKGTYAVSYSNDTDSGTINWTPTVMSGQNPVTIIGNDALVAATTSEVERSGYVLVIPETKSNISFDYKIANSDATLHYTIKVNNEWVAGNNYIYNVTVTPKEVKFTPIVKAWGVEGTETEESL